jgi:hypothetical protein
MSWNLSPEDLAGHACLPSLWRVQRMVLLSITLALLGDALLQHLTQPTADLHRRLANSRRRRKPQLLYPTQSLS